MNIIAMDLGKFNSMACFYDGETGECSTAKAPTERNYFKSVLKSKQPDLVVVEACGPSGWVSDLCQELNLKITSARLMKTPAKSRLTNLGLHSRQRSPSRGDRLASRKTRAARGSVCIVLLFAVFWCAPHFICDHKLAKLVPQFSHSKIWRSLNATIIAVLGL